MTLTPTEIAHARKLLEEMRAERALHRAHPDDHKHFSGDKMRKLRELLGFHQVARFAEVLQVKRQAVYDWEAGGYPGAETLDALERLLKSLIRTTVVESGPTDATPYFHGVRERLSHYEACGCFVFPSIPGVTRYESAKVEVLRLVRDERVKRLNFIYPYAVPRGGQRNPLEKYKERVWQEVIDYARWLDSHDGTSESKVQVWVPMDPNEAPSDQVKPGPSLVTGPKSSRPQAVWKVPTLSPPAPFRLGFTLFATKESRTGCTEASEGLDATDRLDGEDADLYAWMDSMDLTHVMVRIAALTNFNYQGDVDLFKACREYFREILMDWYAPGEFQGSKVWIKWEHNADEGAIDSAGS